ncbi:SDR family oxidoreductase [Nocardiopsis exhalans]|uniref:SDR family oxidoreductase n=1 Tax=Nocardiopsis exhalans TaxID=163604 RepID=A0ABY5D298_9ACTN|nr:SDR family oxidoreductase [Nocardiopsis exhalans]USY17307.1 SDR family oxidoreductase [Nocardiopsis exhalans]
MGTYEGKRAVVVGGTHGMGLGVVEELLAGGAKVLLTGNNEKNLEEVRGSFGPRVQAVRADAARVEDADVLAEAVRETLGGIDFLHVNVGVAAAEPFAAVTEETYEWMFGINAKGAYFTVQRLAPLIAEGGSIVFTTSVTNATGSGGLSVYTGTKAAVAGFARTFAAELMPRKIRVNSVAPGFVRTRSGGFAGASAQERAAIEAAGDQATPMGRHGTVAEVARAVLFLGFDATFTTGAELPVDGGLGPALQPFG